MIDHRFYLLPLFFYFASTSCPNGTFEWKSNCYIFNSTSSGFAKAEFICMQNGGHLTSIHNAFTNDVLAQIAPNYFHESNDFWIGLNSLTFSTIWEWTDGSNFDFKDWGNSEPRNITGANCVAVSMNDGYWRAEDCFESKPFVCILSNRSPITSPTTIQTSTYKTSTVSSTTTSSSSTTTTPFTKQNCSSDWIYFAPTNACYYTYSYNFLDFQSAEKYCVKFDAHLTSIHNLEEGTFLNSYVRQFKAALWVGLYSTDNETTWQWTDDSPFDYSPWGDKQPKPYYGNGTKICAVFSHYVHLDGPGVLFVNDCFVSTWHTFTMCKKTIVQTYF